MILYIGHIEVNKNAKLQLCGFNKMLCQPWNLENIAKISGNVSYLSAVCNSRNLDWIISNGHCGADFPKDHFVPGEKRTHTSKPRLGEALSLDINYWAIQRKTPMEIMWWEL